MKHHTFDHVSTLCDIARPKVLHTYVEESMMATGTRLYKAQSGPQDKVQAQVLSRYVVAWQLLMSGVL